MPSDLPSFGACCPVCKEPVVTMVPGTPGADGAAGAPGASGINSFTLLTDDFELPAVNTSAVAEVGLSTWAQIGQIVVLSDGSNVAYMRVMAKPAVGQMTLLNLGYTENAAPATSFPVGSGIGPAGQQGAAGVADSGELAGKVPVNAVAVGNVALTGEQTIDGVSLVAGDRVLLVGQGVAAQNGIYTVAAGSWVRSPDMDSDDDVFQGVRVLVTQGAVYPFTEWLLVTADPITLDSTNLTFELLPLLDVYQQDESVSSTATIPVTARAKHYFLSVDSGTTDADTTTTFNITGVPNEPGRQIIVHMRCEKGVTAGARTTSLALQINGVAVGMAVATSSSTSAETEHFSEILAWNPLSSRWAWVELVNGP